MIRDYYQLTKPGIVYGNALTTLAAFLFASSWDFAPPLFFATMLGIMLVIASACVFNNYLDRYIDAKMARTKERALVTGVIKAKNALAYGTVLGLIGFALLYFFVNTLTAFLALFAFLMYVVVYGYAKRAGSWGTLVGSIPGAIPIVVGYTAVTNRLDLEALILILILVLWQMPHFYAIAIYRKDDYAGAHIPVLPLTKGIQRTKLSILSYIAVFTLATALLTALGYASYGYLLIIGVAGVVWFVRACVGFYTTDDDRWGRRVFKLSLVVLLAFCAALALAPFLP